MIEVTIFLDEDDVYEGQPMHEYIMHYLLHHRIRGATVFVGVMGFGRKHHLHHPKSLGSLDERPVMILFIDKEENVRPVLGHLQQVVREGLIVTKSVQPLE
jgi:PII-like signaling protein